MASGANKLFSNDSLVANEAQLKRNPKTITVIVEGKELAVDGAEGNKHDPYETPHKEGEYTVIGRCREVYANGIEISNGGDATTCGHSVGPGSDTVIIGE